ncbi:Serpentine receptor class beta-1 [Caenorhabditis elegans]|uniref:Serpentine receptor class beta-1 n=1 Tax=Caenorhabditis elegans TaxID=6239 RepID=SRB1_CAEEL|nr:Serpentine receptor class beta-1 [Caenorhabditis elegans]Q95ZY0.1 RecName: Full=Serpentine receptor class beta-1; Short=Protein srb-1 [Caenorhabditis elegans]CCD65817.1 Serpentine receptor class beta-1 [Caenorhabditis elegans]prf//2123261N chemosensory receptor [Caenorhabditis elegans]|eukprot:NP_494965.1 Serpentine receptor class beta-1 [Caenorhabditis elegans]
MNIENKCDLAFEVTYHPLYRAAQFWTFIFSTLAVPALFIFLLKQIFPLPFHGNIKFMLISYFLSAFLFAVVLALTFGYHILVPLFITSKCDLIIQPYLFKVGQLSLTLFITLQMIMPFGFSIERIIALRMAKSYENVRTVLGPLLIFVLIGIDLILLFTVFRDESFNDSFISFILIPATTAQTFNSYCWILLYAELGNLLCNCIILLVHSKFKTKFLHQQRSLSVRYELEEISQTSKFTLIVSFTHILFIGWYLGVTIFIRTVGETFFGSYINYTVARGVYISVPTYNLTIVFVGIKALSFMNLKRQNNVQSKVQIKSTGSEGARNYENAIASYWNSVSKA